MKQGRHLRHLLIVSKGFLALLLLTMGVFSTSPLDADDDDVEFVTDQVVVKLNPEAGASIAAINADYGTSTLETLLGSLGIYLLQVGPGAGVEEVVDAMKDDPRLLFSEPNFIGHSPEANPRGTWGWGGHDPAPYLEQYAADRLNLPEAHTMTHGAGVVVAVLDTGAQLNHPRLAGRFAAARYDFIDDDPVPADEFNGQDDDADGLIDEGAGHGTHVAGIVNLVAPEASLMPLRVLDSDGRGNDYLMAEAIQFARQNGADVINISLGTPIRSALLEDVVNSAANAGVVIVAAAGNLNNSAEQFPAAFEQALAVTSVGPNPVKSNFASYGSWVDIAAPGESIHSTFPTDGYAHWSGTSMATAFISGQAAMIRSRYPNLSATAVEQLIRTSAQIVEGSGDQLGAGVADIAASVGYLPDGPLTPRCGQLIAQSVVLAAGLSNCGGDGLIIGANGIVIDLNGQTLDGTGLGSGILNPGFDSVRVHNGSIQEFDYGVLLNPGAADNMIAQLTLTENQVAGLAITGTGSRSGNFAGNNTIIANGTGIELLGEAGALLQGNALTRNANTGIYLQGANENTLEGNTLTNARDHAILLEASSRNTLRENSVIGSSDSAITLFDGSDNNTIEENTLIDSSDAGVSVINSAGNEIVANVIQHGSDSGVSLENAHDNSIIGNDLRFNGGGIELGASSLNLIRTNNASQSSGVGIEVGGDSLANVITQNTSSFNGAEGILVEAEILPESTLAGNMIDHNTASENGSRGIAVTTGGHTIWANTAGSNSGWGIYAEAGNIDGGDNVATGNVERSQCYGVQCASSPPPPPDTAAPQTFIDSAPDANTTATMATFTFSVDEDATFECSLDGAPFAGCASPAVYSGLGVGSHTFRTRAIDTTGNVDPSPASHTWTITADCGEPIVLAASADAWLNQGSKAANKGKDTLLKSRAKGTANYRALVQFPQPAIPAGCQIESAVLSLYARAAKNNRTLQAWSVSSAWVETKVNWKNQPATTGAPATTGSGIGYRHWDVTGQFEMMISTGANHGFLIRDASEGGAAAAQTFHSRENATNRPTLTITLGPDSN